MRSVTATLRALPLLALLLVAMGLTPRVGSAAGSNLVVAGAWIRQPPPGSDVAAVYLSLENAGTSAVKLTGVECPIASMAMMHETVESGGQSKMRMLDAVPLAPGATWML